MAVSKEVQATKVAFMLSNGYKPLEPYVNALTKWKCKHLECGKTVSPRFNDIQQGKGGCKPCGNKKSAKAQVFPEKEAIRIMLEARLKPLEPYVNNRTKWKCQCLVCGAITTTLFDTIRSGLGGCINCGHVKRADSQRKDEKIAVAVMLKLNLKPLVPYKNSTTRWKSECLKCGKTVYPTFGSVQYNNNIGCKYCAGNAVDPKDAVEVMKSAKLIPLEPYRSSKTPWKCKCVKCGNVVTPAYAGIVAGQGGCVFCYPAGINLKTPSYLYLISNEMLGSHKIGIGNHKNKKSDDRLQKFVKRGWQVFQVWEFETGKEAWKIERLVFKHLRKDLNIPAYLTLKDMPVTGGHSETMDAELISLPSLKRMVNKIIKDSK